MRELRQSEGLMLLSFLLFFQEYFKSSAFVLYAFSYFYIPKLANSAFAIYYRQSIFFSFFHFFKNLFFIGYDASLPPNAKCRKAFNINLATFPNYLNLPIFSSIILDSGFASILAFSLNPINLSFEIILLLF